MADSQDDDQVAIEVEDHPPIADPQPIGANARIGEFLGLLKGIGRQTAEGTRDSVAEGSFEFVEILRGAPSEDYLTHSRGRRAS